MNIPSRRGIALLAIAALSLALAGQTMTVHRKALDVHKDKSQLGAIVFTANQGDSLEVTDRGTDGWWTVNKPGDPSQTGYVRGIQLTDAKLTPVAGTPSATPLSGSRDADASAAAKGIDPEAVQYAGTKNYDTAPLARMVDTRNSIKPSDVTQFRKDGNLH